MNKTPIKVGSCVKFIEDVPFDGFGKFDGIQKGDSAIVEAVYHTSYEVIDQMGYWHMVDAISVVHMDDYIYHSIKEDKTMNNKSPTEASAVVRFIKDIPEHSIEKGDYADVIEEYQTKYKVEDGLSRIIFIDKSSVVNEADYIEEGPKDKTPIQIGSRVRFIKSVDSLVQTGKYATIKQVHGYHYTVIDDDGAIYMVDKDDVIHTNDYDEWLNAQANKPKSKTMNTLKAIQAMVSGKKVRNTNWGSLHYIYAVNNVIKNETHRPHSFYMSADFGKDEWEEYVEPTKAWKVGDKFTQKYNDDIHTVVYVDENIIFAKVETINNSKGYYYSSFSHSFTDLIPV